MKIITLLTILHLVVFSFAQDNTVDSANVLNMDSLKKHLEASPTDGEGFLLIDNILSIADSVCYNLSNDSLQAVCDERGHVKSDAFFSTLLYCPPYIEENDTIAWKVYPACNTISYTCLRCGEYVSEREKETRIVIWRKRK